MDLLIRGKFPSPIDRTAVAGDWGQRGYSCDLFVDPPGRAWNDFTHRTNELVTVVDGVLEMIIDGTSMTVRPGDEVFVPSNTLHSVKNVHTGTTRWLYGYDQD